MRQSDKDVRFLPAGTSAQRNAAGLPRVSIVGASFGRGHYSI